jgi:hypothetical protein
MVIVRPEQAACRPFDGRAIYCDNASREPQEQ